MNLADMGLSTRTLNALKNDGILTSEQAGGLYEAELMRIPNFGKSCLNELKVIFARVGLPLPRKKQSKNKPFRGWHSNYYGPVCVSLRS